MVKLSLHDGSKKINSIAIVLYFRNTEEYLKEFLIPTLIKLEKIYECTFYYYIFENDSTDNTAALLSQFMINRKGLFVTKKLNLNEISHGSHISRIKRMVYIRNYLLDGIRSELVKHDWCLFIDGDIYFENSTLLKLMSKQPHLHNIGMLTCHTTEVHKIVSDSRYSEQQIRYESDDHYYDTFAYVTKNDIFYYPSCNSKYCKNNFCQEKQAKYKYTQCIDNTSKIPIDIRSAWGGFVLIDASVFKYPNVRWKTLNIGEQALCEHIYLCDMIYGITNKRVVICGDVTCYWVLKQKPD